MAHEVNRLLGSITNTPLLTTPENLRQIQDYLSSRTSHEDLAVISQSQAREESYENPPSVENGVGLLTIEGSLTYKHSWINSLCGIVSYQKLVSDFEALIDQGAHTIALDISSPGGMAHGCFEAAMGLRDMADQAGVRIVTYVDMQACSAAYAIACVSDILIMNPLAKVGSIGVVLSLVNDLPRQIEEGTEVVFVYSGESKIPYEKDGKLREDFIADLQKDTDLLYNDFIKHVAQFRNMSAGEIRDTKAKTFRPTDAMRMGLADKEMTSQEFINYLAEIADDYNRKMSEQQEGKSRMPLFGWKKKKSEDMSEEDVSESLEKDSPSSELLEGNSEGQENLSDPSMQSQEDNEVNMTLEEMLATPEGQAKLKEMAQAEAETMTAEMKEKLAAYEKEQLEAAKAEYKELVNGYSFVQADAKETVATFLYEASEMGMDGVEQIMEALESAKNAVEAATFEEEGDAGEQLEVDPETVEKSMVSDLIKQRYAKQ